MTISIIPLCVGILRNLPKSILVGAKGLNSSIDVPSIMWYLKGTKENIIVDTGPSVPLGQSSHLSSVEKTPDHEIEKVLASVGVCISEVKIVINTHLHWDHCSSNKLFKNAEFITQRKELQYAIAPFMSHQSAYEPKDNFLSVINRFNLVDGDEEIIPGVQVIQLPGHTPGHQGVLVKCDNANYLISGDCIGLYESWDECLIGSIYVNLEEYYASFKKIANLDAKILPGHDEKVFSTKEFC
ncbi:MAG: N-acyl homoserine lactonase family protein [Bacillota bacterium]|nr:N-acyl homoserine lactonase family protein [Bacillota bacterium]